MEEAADADYVVILDSGKHLRRGNTARAEERLHGDFITLYGIAGIRSRRARTSFERIGDAFRISVPDTASATKLIIENPGLFGILKSQKEKWTMYFFAVTGKKLGQGTENDRTRRSHKTQLQAVLQG